MVAQKCQKKMLAEIFLHFWMSTSEPKTQLIKTENSFDSSRPYGRLLENQKTGAGALGIISTGKWFPN